jgi:hypothetical protein
MNILTIMIGISLSVAGAVIHTHGNDDSRLFTSVYGTSMWMIGLATISDGLWQIIARSAS